MQQIFPSSTPPIPHPETTDPYDNLLLEYHAKSNAYRLSKGKWKILAETTDEHKPRTSWSTYLRHTFSFNNPMTSLYLQRGIGLTAVAFSYFSEKFPLSPLLTNTIAAAYEFIPLIDLHDRDWIVGLGSILFGIPVSIIVIIVTAALGGLPFPDSRSERWNQVLTILPSVLFNTLVVANSYFTYRVLKPENDFKLQLENLRELLQQHPELAQIAELRHHNIQAEDDAFVDHEDNIILSPFYHLIYRGENTFRQYIGLDMLFEIVKQSDQPTREIFCDRARFKKVLTIFRNAQTQNV